MLIDDDGNWRELLKFSTQTTDGDIRAPAGVPLIRRYGMSPLPRAKVVRCNLAIIIMNAFIPRPCESA